MKKNKKVKAFRTLIDKQTLAISFGSEKEGEKERKREREGEEWGRQRQGQGEDINRKTEVRKE